MQKTNPLRKYIRNEKLPHFFCPGCGCGQVLNAFTRAIDDLGINIDNIVTIGGVGCTACIPIYLNADTLHGVHGRTLAWATGIKLHKPDLKVVIFAGDGDLASIGGNHFIHAARRNLDVTVILVNNFNFAMTGGQVAPTTPVKTVTMTTPFGSEEPRFDICELAVTAGATHVSRSTTNKPYQTKNAIKKGLQHEGFALVEIMSQCPTHFGRYALKSGKPEVMLEWMEAQEISIKEAAKLTAAEKAEKLVLGEFINIQKPTFKGSSVYKEEGCCQ